LRDVFLRPIDDLDTAIQTTDATAGVVAARVKPNPGTVTRFDAEIIGRKVGGGDAIGFNSVSMFITDGAGAVTQVGSPIVSANMHTAGAAAWAASISTDGTYVNFKVTGQAATLIDWRVVGGSNEVPGS